MRVPFLIHCDKMNKLGDDVMFALIKGKDKEYYSPILAEYSNKWKSKVLVFDSKHENLILQDYWMKKVKCVYVLDSTQVNWVTIGKYSGKKDILQNPGFLSKIKKGKIPIEVFERYKDITVDFEVKEWYPIQNDQHVNRFNDLAFGLHDGYVLAIEEHSEYTMVTFDTTWSLQIQMKFYDVKEFNLIDYGPVYTTSYFEFIDNKIIFKPDLCWDEEGIEDPKVICSKIEYKIFKTENAFTKSKK